MNSKKYFFALFLFFLLASEVYSKSIIDSLVASMPVRNDTNKVLHYFKIISALNNQSNNLKWTYAQKALELSDELAYANGRALSFEKMAIILYDRRKVIQALEYSFIALDIYKQSNQGSKSANILINIGFIFLHYNDVTTAKTYAKFAAQKLFIQQQTSIDKETINSLMDLQLKLEVLEDVKHAIENYDTCFYEIQNASDISFLINKSRYYLMINDFEKALALAKQSQIYSKFIKEGRNEAQIKTFLITGEIFANQNKEDSAIYYYEKSVKLSKESGEAFLELVSYKQLSHLFLKENKIDEAKGYAEKYYQTAIKSSFFDNAKTALLLKSKIFSLKNDLANAYSSLISYNRINDSLARVENNDILNSLIYKRGLAESQYLNKKLVEENKKKDEIIQRKQILQFGLILVSLFIFIFAIFVIFLFVRYRLNNALLKAKTEEILHQNETLELQNLLLEKLNFEKNGLIGVVSHDLKAPLNRVEGLLALVVSDGNLNPEQNTYLKVSQKELYEAKEMIKKILDTELKNADEAKLKIEKIDLIPFMNEIINNYRIVASNKSIQIIDNFKQFHIEVFSDKNYLSRILDNLLSNAIKFSESYKNIYVDAFLESDQFQIIVEDQGPGFTDEDKTKIFKKYQKLSARPTRGENSTGLGLHIVHMLIVELKGSIQLDSKPNVGSTFKLTFPKVINQE